MFALVPSRYTLPNQSKLATAKDNNCSMCIIIWDSKFEWNVCVCVVQHWCAIKMIRPKRRSCLWFERNDSLCVRTWSTVSSNLEHSQLEQCLRASRKRKRIPNASATRQQLPYPIANNPIQWRWLPIERSENCPLAAIPRISLVIGSQQIWLCCPRHWPRHWPWHCLRRCPLCHGTVRRAHESDPYLSVYMLH